MKKISALIAISWMALSIHSKATVTLEFSQAFVSGIASNFSNAAGTPTDGMAWGIIVDTTGNGFASSGTAYNAYATPGTAGFLSSAGALTDDYFIPGGTTQNFTGQLEGDFTTAGGHGTIAISGAIPLTNIASGEKFALVWLATSTANAGDKYGFLSITGGSQPFVIPPDTQLGDYGGNFTGVDPNRAASNTFTSAVPEPSTSLLALLGGVGLMMRRRRK